MRVRRGKVGLSTASTPSTYTRHKVLRKALNLQVGDSSSRAQQVNYFTKKLSEPHQLAMKQAKKEAKDRTKRQKLLSYPTLEENEALEKADSVGLSF
jgi:hypothetical protein